MRKESISGLAISLLNAVRMFVLYGTRGPTARPGSKRHGHLGMGPVVISKSFAKAQRNLHQQRQYQGYLLLPSCPLQ